MVSLRCNSHCYPHFTDVETETQRLRSQVTLSSHTSKGSQCGHLGSLAPKSKLINTKLCPILWWLCGCGWVLNWEILLILDSPNPPSLLDSASDFLYSNSYLQSFSCLEGGDKDQISWTQTRWGWDGKLGWPESLHRIDSFCWSKSSGSHCWQLVVTQTPQGQDLLMHFVTLKSASNYMYWSRVTVWSVLQCTLLISFVNSGSACWWNVRAKRDPWEPGLWPSAPFSPWNPGCGMGCVTWPGCPQGAATVQDYSFTRINYVLLVSLLL